MQAFCKRTRFKNTLTIARPAYRVEREDRALTTAWQCGRVSPAAAVAIAWVCARWREAVGWECGGFLGGVALATEEHDFLRDIFCVILSIF